MTQHGLSRWLRSVLLALWVGSCLLMGGTTVLAQGLQPLPELRARVMDQTGTLDAASVARIEHKLTSFEQARGSQVVVLMIGTTAPEDIADYTQRLGDAWKIGRRDIGDGVLFVIAKDDRRLRIATAKTLEGAIPDLAASRIIDQVVTPAFRTGNFAGGIEAGVDHILARIAGENLALPSSDTQTARQSPQALGDLLVFMVFAVPIISAVLRSLFGNKLGILLTGGGAAGLAWMLTAVFWIAVGAGLLGMLAALFLQHLPAQTGSPGRRGGRGNGGWGGPGGGGGWGGGSTGGGGFGSGGGGNFGGGGASGRW